MRTLQFIVRLGSVALLLWGGAAVAQQCCGDCNGDGTVTVNELVTAVNYALASCPTSGARFVDNGDGTLTDRKTGLTWEKKSNDGGIHDKDDVYAWSATGADPDGGAFSSFVATLNAQAFGGHQDWRLPTIDELQDLLDHSRANPSVVSAFDDNCQSGCASTTCSCTAPSPSWSSTTYLGDQNSAWTVAFDYGYVGTATKTFGGHVRAVRGGS